MKKKINLIIVSLIVTVILGINISYAITANDASNSKSSFFSVNKEKLSQGDTLEMTIDLSQIDYEEFEFRLSSNVDMDEIYADDDSADNNNITVNSENADSDLSLNINKKNLDLSKIVLYYQIPDSIKVGTKIKLNAQIVINEEDDSENESANNSSNENSGENEGDGSASNNTNNNGASDNGNVNDNKNNDENSKTNTNNSANNNEKSSEKIVDEKQIEITIVKQDSNSNNANMGNGNLGNDGSNGDNGSSSNNDSLSNGSNSNGNNANGDMQNPNGSTNNTGNAEQGSNSKNPDQIQTTGQSMQGMSNMQTQTSNNSSSSMNTLQSASGSETLKSASAQVETATYNGSNNNYLSSLEIDGVELTSDFNKEKLTYFATVEGLDSITVTATAEDSDSKVSVTGTDLKSGENKILISVTAENGNVRYYRIYVTNN
jgi:hypothetical protein